MRHAIRPLLLATAVAALLGGCGERSPDRAGDAQAGPEEKMLRVYSRADQVGADTVAGFRKATGIQVDHRTYDSAAVFEIKLLVGQSGYDVVAGPATLLGRQAEWPLFLELDPAQLPRLENLDPAILEQVAAQDPGNRHAVPYLWGTTGIGYNPALVRRALGTDRIDGWAALFEPGNAARLKDCGIAMLDSAGDVLGAALLYLGRDPDGENAEDLAAAEAALLAIGPSVRYVDTTQYVAGLAGGEICIALGRSGDLRRARARGAAAEPPVTVEFTLPAEGALLWFDVLAIPADAPHPDNAHAFINHLLDPQVIAGVTARTGYANGNAASLALLDAAVRDDPVVYPTPEIRSRLHARGLESPAYRRLAAESWARIRAGE